MANKLSNKIKIFILFLLLGGILTTFHDTRVFGLTNAVVDEIHGDDTSTDSVFKTINEAIEEVKNNSGTYSTTILISSKVSITSDVIIDGQLSAGNITLKYDTTTLIGHELINVSGFSTLTLKNITIDGAQALQTAISVKTVSTLNILENTKIINCKTEAITIDATSNAYVEDAEFSNNGQLQFDAAVFFVAGQLEIKSALFKNNAGNSGTAIYNEGGSTTNITNATFESNQAVNGTIFLKANSTLNIKNAVFKNNTASSVGNSNGSCIYNLGRVNIKYAEFKNNITTGIGTIFNAGTLDITDVLFENNTAGTGGAISSPSATSFLSVNKGDFINNTATGFGGALYLGQTDVKITNANFSENQATSGGAIYKQNRLGSLQIYDSTFLDNSATINGGAIYSESGALFIDNAVFNKNHSTQFGGALYLTANINASITNSEFTENQAQSAGAIYLDSSTVSPSNLHISNCEFKLNSSTQNAGALYLMTNAVVNIYNSTFISNSASFSGGAIYSFSKLTIYNSTINNNTSSSSGGAIFNQHTLTLNNVILDKNESMLSNAGAIYSTNAQLYLNTVTLTNNKAWGNGGAIYFDGSNKNTHYFIINEAIIHSNISGSKSVYYNRYQGIYYNGGLFSLNSSSNTYINDIIFIENSSTDRLLTLSSEVQDQTYYIDSANKLAGSMLVKPEFGGVKGVRYLSNFIYVGETRLSLNHVSDGLGLLSPIFISETGSGNGSGSTPSNSVSFSQITSFASYTVYYVISEISISKTRLITLGSNGSVISRYFGEDIYEDDKFVHYNPYLGDLFRVIDDATVTVSGVIINSNGINSKLQSVGHIFTLEKGNIVLNSAALFVSYFSQAVYLKEKTFITSTSILTISNINISIKIDKHTIGDIIVKGNGGVSNFLVTDDMSSYNNNYSLYVSSNNLLLNSNLVFYVSPVGDDVSNNGSVNNPFKTLQKAISDLNGRVGTIVVKGTVLTTISTTTLDQSNVLIKPFDSDSKIEVLAGHQLKISNRITILVPIVLNKTSTIDAKNFITKYPIVLRPKISTYTSSKEVLVINVSDYNAFTIDSSLDLKNYSFTKEYNYTSYELSLQDKTINSNTYYVSSSGDDTKTGTTPEQAFKTLTKAYQALSTTGGVIIVVGNYNISSDTIIANTYLVENNVRTNLLVHKEINFRFLNYSKLNVADNVSLTLKDVYIDANSVVSNEIINAVSNSSLVLDNVNINSSDIEIISNGTIYINFRLLFNGVFVLDDDATILYNVSDNINVRFINLSTTPKLFLTSTNTLDNLGFIKCVNADVVISLENNSAYQTKITDAVYYTITFMSTEYGTIVYKYYQNSFDFYLNGIKTDIPRMILNGMVFVSYVDSTNTVYFNSDYEIVNAITGDLTLAPTYEIMKSTITLEKVGGTTTTTSYVIEYNDTSIVFEPITKEKHLLVGFILDDGRMLFDSEGNLLANVYPFTNSNCQWIYDKDVLIYAKYLQNQDGEAEVLVDDVYYGDVVTYTITSANYTLREYTVMFSNDNDQDDVSKHYSNLPTEAGRYYIIVTIPRNDFYKELVVKKLFVISARMILESEFSLITDPYTYDGVTEYEPQVSSSIPYTYFAVNYNNNINASNVAEVIITGVINYDGQVILYFTILKADYDFSMISFDDENKVFDDSVHEIEITGTLPTGVSVSYIYSENEVKNAGVYDVTAIFTHTNSNYNEIPNMTAKLTIDKAVTIFDTSNVVSVFNYNGYNHQVTGLEINHDTSEIHYYQQNIINAGIYQVTAYTDETTNYYSNFIILEIEVRKIAYDMSLADISSTVSFVYLDQIDMASAINTLPSDDIGYSFIYFDHSFNMLSKLPKNVGFYHVRVAFDTRNSNYLTPESIFIVLEITPKLLTNQVEDLSIFLTYTGSEITPPLKINELTPDDYIITYTNNINVGVASVTVEAINNYYGTVTKTFNITKAFYNMTVVFSDETFVYDGNNKTIELTTELPEFFEVVYSYQTLGGKSIDSAINVGEYIVIAKIFSVSDNYFDFGQRQAKIIITRKSISDYIFTTVDSVIYNRSEHTPVILVDQLVLNKDYTIVYQNNINAGKANILISGIGNYKDSKQVEFIIEKATYNVSNARLDDLEVVYNGSVHNLKITGSLPQGVWATYSPGQVDVGVYTIVCTFHISDTNNYNLPAPISAKLTITRAQATINTDAIQKVFVYNNREFSIYGATLNHNETQVEYSIKTVRNAGTYICIATSSQTKNYYASSKTFVVVVNKAEVNMSKIEFLSKTFVYNKTEHKLSISGVLPSFVQVTYTEGLTEVGTKTITASFNVLDSNYKEIPSMTATITVTKATLSVTSNLVYLRRGTNTFEFERIYTGFYTGDDESDILVHPYVEIPNGVGTYSVRFKGGEAKNYDFIYVPFTIVIQSTQDEIIGVFDEEVNIAFTRDGITEEEQGKVLNIFKHQLIQKTVKITSSDITKNFEFRLYIGDLTRFRLVVFENNTYLEITEDEIANMSTATNSKMTYVKDGNYLVIKNAVASTYFLLTPRNYNTLIINIFCMVSLTITVPAFCVVMFVKVKRDEDLLASLQLEDDDLLDGSLTQVKATDTSRNVEIINTYKYSFEASLSLTSQENKVFYSEIKNKLLSLRNVDSLLTYNYDRFVHKEKNIAFIKFRGQELCLYFNLDIPKEEIDKYKLVDMSSISRYKDCKYQLPILSEQDVIKAFELITLLDIKTQSKPKVHDYIRDYQNDETFDSLMDIEEIIFISVEEKEIVPVDEDDELGFSDEEHIIYRPSVASIEANALISDELAKSQIIRKKGIVDRTYRETVNIDYLSQMFKDGDVINIEILKSRGFINKKVTYIKILASGELNKRLIIEANDFSLIAVKMIEITGGSVIVITGK